MPSFSDLQTYVDENIRKALQISIFAAPMSVEDEIATLTDATGLLVLPVGYTDVGRITKDQGGTWTRDIETSDVMSAGASQPTRTDIISDQTGLQFTMQESKRQVLEMHEGVDLSEVTPDVSGNVTWDKPDRPRQDYYRILALGKDGEGAEAIYFAKWLPRARITERGEQVWGEENELQYPVTLSAFNDSTVGTAVRTLWSGSADALARMGFTA